jgi:choline dehydrogenase-like flavoprotein
MPVVTTVASGESYDLILVGTGFASTFFLHRYLQQASAATRVLVVERGALHEHRWQVQHSAELERESAQSFQNRTPTKPWIFRVAVGGSSNCWWACTPRMLPDDFQLATRYGIGRDWPVTYDQLEYYYGEAEALMSVSGASDGSPAPRSRPFPLPPHRFTDPDRLLKRHFPDAFFPQPTARPSRATATRARCCASGICEACPIDSKFTILNTLRHLYEDDPRVTLLTGARVDGVDVVNGVATGVRYATGSGEQIARGALVGLGANAIFNPTILLRSGLTAGPVGIGLMEQVSAVVDIDLDGVENFQGSTSITGLGYMLHSGRNRGVKAAAIMESWNVPRLRPQRGKWRQFLSLKFIFEALPRPENRVLVETSDDVRPVVTYHDHGPTTERGLVDLEADLPSVLAALPVEQFTVRRTSPNTEAHVLGTTTMGHNPSESVVDGALVHHRVRNLLVLGGSVFPTAAPANPTLTIAALSLRAADQLLA